MKSRPDSPAILGLIGLAGLVIVGWIILTALGKTVPGEAWGLVLTLAGIVGGWVGKTLASEPVEVLAPESLPISYSPPNVEIVESHPPVTNDVAERQRISDYLSSDDEFVAGPDVPAPQDRAERSRISQYLAEASKDVPQPE